MTWRGCFTSLPPRPATFSSSAIPSGAGRSTIATSGATFLVGDLWGDWEGDLVVTTLKDEDLRRYRDKLSTADFKHFVDVQGKLTKGEDSAQVATATQQKDSMVKALGLKNEDAGVFHQEADKALFAAQSAKGRALDQTERQKVLDGLVLEGKTPGTLWDSSTRAFKARAEGKPFTPVWNDAQKNKATEALKRQGINKPTDQQIDATLRAVFAN